MRAPLRIGVTAAAAALALLGSTGSLRAQPGGALGIVIPDAARAVLTQGELVEAVCATSRWRALEMFAAIDAVAATQPAAQQALADAGFTYRLPDPEAFRKRGTDGLAAVCSAPTVDLAVARTSDLIAINNDLETAYRSAVEAALGAEAGKIAEQVSAQVRTEIDLVANQKRTDAEKSLQAEGQAIADRIVANKKASYEATLSAEAAAMAGGAGTNPAAIQAAMSSRVAALQAQAQTEIRAEVEAALQTRIATIKDNITAEVQAIAKQRETAERTKWDQKQAAIVAAFTRVADETKARTTAARNADSPERRQAAEVRVRLAMKVVDVNLAEARKTVNAARPEFDALKASNPTKLNADEVLAALQRERDTLEAKLRAAIAVGDETGFTAATLGFQKYWEEFAKDVDAAAGVWTPARVCQEAKPGLDSGRQQGEAAQAELAEAKRSVENAKGNDANQQARLDAFRASLDDASARLTTFLADVRQSQEACANPSGDARALIARLSAARDSQTRLQSAYEQLRLLAQSLQ